jgi:maltooligosyltrehalose trehalohydrolase
MKWQPSLGAWPEADGTRFRVWAPEARQVEVVLDQARHALAKAADGTFGGFLSGIQAGARYRYRIDGQGPFPDPASRFQPEGVHGPSAIVAADQFQWSDSGWQGVQRDNLVIYELHVGTFTAAGNLAAVREHLPHLVELGVTAIELLPVADFPGQRNWGYDGVALFAPARCYGTPDDLRRLVNEAHRLGLAVLLDVVYNHLGPDGNYLGVYSPYYFSKKHRNPWGAGLNFDGPHCAMVRRFFIENALHWIHEYHIDGLRLDATQAIVDDSPQHFLAELSTTLRASVPERPIALIAEDDRNLATMVQPPAQGGWGLDGVWADDFHHQVRCGLAGDRESYYADFTGSMADLATTIRQGWFYTGQHSVHAQAQRGTDPSQVPPGVCVVCIQNHDQVGNRALGERLHHQIDLAAYRAATVLLLTVPETPLLFMGQEWAATSPFQFFTDHHPELGRKVTEGRRREFRHFAAFSDPKARERIPDPQAARTFAASKLKWEERAQEPHAALLGLHRKLLQLRRSEPALACGERGCFEAFAVGETALVLRREAQHGPALLVALQMRGAGRVDARKWAGGRRWEAILSTEDGALCPDPQPMRIEAMGPVIDFARPGALILREGP